MLLKNQVQQSFNDAAPHYDRAARLQQLVALDLLAHITKNQTAEIIIDLGCGTGFFTNMLAEKFPQTSLLGIDFAENMLYHAQLKNKSSNMQWICAEAECLPFKTASIHSVASNLMLQWSSDLTQNLLEIYRVLKPSGQLFFSSFAPGSLHELNTAWQKVDNAPHVHTFISKQRLLDHFKKAKFHLTHISQKSYTLYYPDALTLMRTLKMLGASNKDTERNQGLTGKKKLLAAIAAYEVFRNAEKKLPATYEIYFGVMTK